MESADSKGGEEQADGVRRKVDEWLAGIGAVRGGVLDVFFIEGPENSSIRVTPENADSVEGDIRTIFSRSYPDLLPDTAEM